MKTLEKLISEDPKLAVKKINQIIDTVNEMIKERESEKKLLGEGY